MKSQRKVREKQMGIAVLENFGDGVSKVISYYETEKEAIESLTKNTNERLYVGKCRKNKKGQLVDNCDYIHWNKRGKEIFKCSQIGTEFLS